MATIALAKEAIRFTSDQAVMSNPRFLQTGAIYNEKQFPMIPVGINDRINAAARTPQPLNFLPSILFSFQI